MNIANIKYCYTDKELKELLSSIILLIDTSEQQNGHILSYFDLKGIKYRKKLDYGGYAA